MSSATITSFTIGAILLLAIVSLESRIMRNSEGITLDQMNKEHLTAVTQIVSSDVRKIGYGVTSGTGIQSYTPNEISFKCDLYNNGTLHQVTWKFDKTLTNTQNPNVGTLVRTVDGVTTKIPYGISQFEVTLLNSLGQKTTTLANVKQVQIEIECQSTVKSNNNYLISTWQQTFTPVNL